MSTIQERFYTAKQNERAETACDAVTRLVNGYGDSNILDFISRMSVQHRTLQNSFTKLCLMWIEFAASDEYRTDARNASGKDISQKLLEAFREKMAKEYSGGSLDIMAKPSGYCHMV